VTDCGFAKDVPSMPHNLRFIPTARGVGKIGLPLKDMEVHLTISCQISRVRLRIEEAIRERLTLT